jgi:tetratricopeptide (TPR) repeat protein
LRSTRCLQPFLLLALLPLLGTACAPHATAPPEAAVAPSPADPRAAYQKAEWARATAGLEYDESSGLAEVRRASGANAAAALAHRMEADELFRQNRVVDAIEKYVLAVRHDRDIRDMVPAWIGIGTVLRRKGELEHAIAAFRTALDRDENDLDARYELATTLWAATRQAEAIASMNELLALDEDHPRAHERLAVWSYYVGDDTAAWSHLERARELGEAVPAQLVPLLEQRAAER